MTTSPGTALIPHSTITEMGAFRNAAMASMQEAASLLHAGGQKAEEAQAFAQRAHGLCA